MAIETPFMAFPEYYAADCVDDEGIYLEVRHADEVPPAQEQRWTPIDYQHPYLSTGAPFGSGLHQYDFALSMGDLLKVTKKKAKRLPDESGFCVVR